MMMELNLHGEAVAIASLADLRQALARAQSLAQCELWLTMTVDAEQGPALCMLKNGASAWLMYLSGQDAASCHSLGDEEEEGECSYWLANGQVDVYPAAWCVELALCHRAMAAFFTTGGARPAAVEWQPD
ncbi:Imm1 family immunity protein [Janthinobacterium psychrotolerans]|uniref:Immunity protein Imm1 n=1 Tax=Janthinobacterium psychrotolerans TaxID=1747903 RepID=A0A1A7C089_9BURK|nr:Imm1 family immunity protein [Janthinobacterium psychrotolerans]OBV38419.1 Immunity protein Imm1 [Janthinobacterium psychrotolerans]